MKHTRALTFLALLALSVLACDDDPERPGGEPKQLFQPLTTRNAVLNNLELAWTQRRTDKINELLDADFVFYFDEGDVGGEIPPSWDRNTEMVATDALFMSNTVPAPTVPVCLNSKVDLVFDDELPWVETPVPATASGEVWYTATVNYSFTFEMEGDLTYIQNNAKAQFVVRQVGDEWRLVEWRDLGQTNVTSNTTEISQTSTWGQIKSLYD